MAGRRSWPQVLPWLALITLPGAVFLVLRLRPELDFHSHSPEGHFYIVSLSSILAVSLGFIACLAATRAGNLRLALLSLSFFAVSPIFAVHGLSTPGFIVDERYELVTAVSSRLAVLLASAFLFLSAVAWPARLAEIVQPRIIALMAGWGLVFVAFMIVALGAPQLIPASLTQPALKHASFTAVLVLAAFSAWKYFLGYRRSGLPMYGAVTLGSILLVEAQLGMEYGIKYQATWWLYHMLLLAAFSAVMWGVFLEYARGRSPLLALEGLSLTDPIEQIQAGYTESVMSFAKALEARDGYTLGHSERVAALSALIGEKMKLAPEHLRSLYQGALLHDVGKIGIPDRILHSTERLSDEDFEVIKEHPVRGGGMLQAAFKGRIELAVIQHHHERFDGTGYPERLAGEAIPVEARIAAVADVYDALRSTRSYRPPWSRERALEYMKQQVYIHFDPSCVRVLLEIVDIWEARYADDHTPYAPIRKPA